MASMKSNSIFVDFNNRDEGGCLRLNTAGTNADLEKFSIALEGGLRLHVSDGDLMANIVVRRPASEGIWRGQILEGPFELDSADDG